MRALTIKIDVSFEKEQVKHVSQELCAVRPFFWFARSRGLISPFGVADQGPHGRAWSTVLEIYCKWNAFLMEASRPSWNFWLQVTIIINENLGQGGR